MLASSGSRPPGGGWVAEVKWDGFRIVATVADGRLSLRSRPGSNATGWFPELAELPPALEGREAVLDGEVVICGPDGRPAFHLLPGSSLPASTHPPGRCPGTGPLAT